jgi:hypothetical protein
MGFDDAHSRQSSRCRAEFHLCPTGDSKGFTARLYFSIVHHCIPVWIDGFGRGLQWSELAWPFPLSIDWRRVVIFGTLDDVLNGALMRKLVHLQTSREAEARLGYMRTISHHLVFDRQPGAPDASDAALREIEHRVLRPR